MNTNKKFNYDALYDFLYHHERTEGEIIKYFGLSAHCIFVTVITNATFQFPVYEGVNQRGRIVYGI